MKNVRSTLSALAVSGTLLGALAGPALARVANDPEVPRMYALGSIRAAQAWDVTTGSAAVRVAMVDDGVDPELSDLAPNLDMAGGYDFAMGDPDARQDVSEHGSQTASLLGTRGNNGLGMAGVSWDVRLVPLKVRKDGPGERFDLITPSAVADAFRYAGASGARVANASFGLSSSTSAAGRDAVLAGLRASPDTLFVVSAGNSSRDNDATPRYPCNYDVPNLLCVAATTQGDGLAGFSNYGARSVDLAAPGDQVLTVTGRSTFGLVDGTSYSAPLVSGVAALYFSRYPEATVADARAAILGGVDELPGLKGKMVSGGRLNAERTLSIAPAAPAPTPTPTPTPTLTPTTGPGVSGTGAPATVPQPPVPTPPPTTTTTTGASTPATVTVARRQKLRTVLRSGVRVSVTTATKRSVGITLRLSTVTARRLRVPAVLGTATLDRAAGRTSVRVRLRRTATKRLAKARGVRVRVTVKVSGDPSTTRPTTVVRSVVLP